MALAFINQLTTGVGVAGVLFGGFHVSCPLMEIQSFVSLWFVYLCLDSFIDLLAQKT